MRCVLADIKNGKICGLYGGRSEKYWDMWNYIASTNIQKCGYKFNNIDDAMKVKKALNNTGVFCPNFEIIVIDE